MKIKKKCSEDGDIEPDIESEIYEPIEEEDESDDKITRSIRIGIPYTEVVITTESKDEDLDKLKKVAEAIIDKYRHHNGG